MEVYIHWSREPTIQVEGRGREGEVSWCHHLAFGVFLFKDCSRLDSGQLLAILPQSFRNLLISQTFSI